MKRKSVRMNVSITRRLKKSGVSSVIVLIVGISKLLRFDKEVELILDSCPPTFDFTEAGDKTIEEIDRSILVMEAISRVDMQ